MTLLLHGIPGSPFVNSALLALGEAGAEYELVAMSFDQKGSKETAVGRLNPFGRVPVLEDGAFSLYETHAILRYVAALYPAAALMPAEVRARARMDQLMGLCDSYLMPLVVRTIVNERLFARFWNRPGDEDKIAAAIPDATLCLREIERLTAKTEYAVSDSISLADVHIFPFLHYVSLTPEGRAILQSCPHLSTWLSLMRRRKTMAGLNLIGLERG